MVMSRGVEGDTCLDACQLLEDGQVVIGFSIGPYLNKVRYGRIVFQNVQCFSMEHQVEWDTKVVTCLLTAYSEPFLFLDVCKAVVIQLFEVGKPKSGVTAEQEGVAYMSQLAGGCGLLHPTKLVGVQEAVRGSFVADVEVSERIVLGL